MKTAALSPLLSAFTATVPPTATSSAPIAATAADAEPLSAPPPAPSPARAPLPPPHPPASPAAPALSTRLYRHLTLRAFGAMPRGRLELTLPDGSTHLCGARTHVHWHAAAAHPAARAISEHAAIRIHRDAFWKKCVLHGDIGFAESYLDGDWDTPDLSAVIAWFVLNLDFAPALSGSRTQALGLNLLRAADRLGHVLRPNSHRTAVRNIREHYDLSNAFFRLWLDPSLMYSSARWESGTSTASLAAAQRAKNDALCRQLQLSARDRVLEIGTGWGGWSLHAANHYGCHVTTLTLSQEQYDLARERVEAAGLAHRIEVRLQDYRALPADERYDKIVSIEMLEAVGHRYLPEWCRVVARALQPQGLMALQFITCPDARYPEFRRGVDFIQKHIFPGSLLLSVNRLNELLATHGGFVLHRLEDFGPDYARTLRLWRRAFHARAEDVRALGFDDRFQRKWHYYLSYCEAAFALRNISVVQTVHTRPNNLALA